MLNLHFFEKKIGKVIQVIEIFIIFAPETDKKRLHFLILPLLLTNFIAYEVYKTTRFGRIAARRQWCR